LINKLQISDLNLYSFNALVISQDGKIENEEFKVLKENPNVYLHTTGIFQNLRNF